MLLSNFIATSPEFINLHLVPQLRKVYEPHNQRLFKFLGYSIPEWSDENLEATPRSDENTKSPSHPVDSNNPAPE